ncbi:MAG TPA: AMP-binding protein [Candidatus Binatia bacterium]|nr:AMP-binding protein [Candidatus Binatia bacterium]
MEKDAQSLEEQISRIMPLMTAADFCDRNAREFAANEALVDRRQRLTWSQVKQLSDRLAAGLVKLGLRRDGRLLVQLPNCAELFITRLACEKAGVRLITVTSAFRLAELAPIIRFTGPEAAIIPKVHRGVDYVDLLEAARTEKLQRVIVTGDEVPSGTLSFEEMLASAATDDGAERFAHRRYRVVYTCQIATTSGSTGTPKCVEVPLYTRLLTGWIHLKRFGVSAADRLAAATPIVTGTADALVYNGGCAVGAAVVLMDHFAPDECCSLMAAEQVSVIPLVPTMIARLLAIPDLSRYDLQALRIVVSHGASLPRAQGEEIEKKLGCRIVQAYGSVDCGGISATCWNDPQDVRLGTLGRPLDGNEVKIVDSDGREVPPGEVGKLLVRGLHTDAGFLNNRVLNARRRVNGYFDLQERGKIDRDGNIILMGREQDLIIRGGQNIFPADIEAVLIQHPKILEVSVVGLPDPTMGERVCAFVVCRDGPSATLNEIVSFLEEKGLARFKWPERLEVLETLPKVASGHKIDKQKLKESLVTTSSGQHAP